MIDKFIVPASVHVLVGSVVLGVTLLALVLVGMLAWRGRPLTRLARGVLIVAQMVLMLQALIGIKLLDQGAGPLQLYIHYVGGVAPIGFFLAMYWWPFRNPRTQSRVAALVTVGAFLFALMTFTIGQAYVQGSL